MGKSKGQCFNFKSVSVSSVIIFSVLSFVSVSVPSVQCEDDVDSSVLKLKLNSTSFHETLVRLRRQFGFGGGSTSFIGLGIMNELNAGDYIEIDNSLDEVLPPRRGRNRGKRSPEPAPGFKYGRPHYGYHKELCLGSCGHSHPPPQYHPAPPPPQLKKVIFHHYYHPAPVSSTTAAPFTRKILTETQERFQHANQDYPTAQRLVQSVLQNSRNPGLRRAIVIKQEGVRCEDVCSVPGNVTFGLLGICTENYCRCNSNADGNLNGNENGFGLNPPAPLRFTQETCAGNEVFDPLKLECDLPYNTLLCSDLRQEPTAAPKPEIHIKYVPVYYPVHYKQIVKVEPALAVVKQPTVGLQLVQVSPVAIQPVGEYLPPAQPAREYLPPVSVPAQPTLEYLPPAQPSGEYLPPAQQQGQQQQVFLQAIQSQPQQLQQHQLQSGQALVENYGTQIQHPGGVSQQTRSSGHGNVQSQSVSAPVQLVQVQSQGIVDNHQIVTIEQPQQQPQEQHQLLVFSSQNQLIDSTPIQITSDNKKKRRRRVRVKKGHRRVKAVQESEESANYGEKTAES